jgi:asparagine synthase (glutamine-hydrolysing)
MCGICGYIDYRNPIEDRRALIHKMCDLMAHRGPDAHGYYFKDNIALGHRRLSIIDLSTGTQPMSDADKTVWIVYNGEIYNFLEIKKNLIQKGYSFRTRSDTEVLINGYQAYGINLLDHINGMFSFVIWDEKEKRLFAARDRLGKKPLYYYHDDKCFIFSSELKSLIINPEISREINIEAVDQYFSFGYIPAPLTIFKNIYKLRAAHYLIWKNGNIQTDKYWDVEYHPSEVTQSEDEYLEELMVLLKESIHRRLISDVPLGAFLSGGIDSSTVVGLMSQVSSERVKTFTIGFSERQYSEVDDAKSVADKFDTQHHEYTVSPNAVEIIPKIVWHFDEPFADSSAIPTYYVSQIARKHVTVILSGDGGDELFAGYKRYMEKNQYEIYKSIPRFIREKIIGRIARSLPISAKGRNFLLGVSLLEKKQNLEIIELYPYIKNDLFTHDFIEQLGSCEAPGSLIDYWGGFPQSSLLSKMQYFDTKIYLPDDILVKVDRMSMAHSLETRAPLLDYHLVEFAARIPAELQMKDGKGKYLLRKLAEKLLPQQVLAKRKQGFAIPANEWFQKELFEYAYDLLTASRFEKRGYFIQKNINLMLNEHRKGRRDYSTWIWSLIIFEIWHQTFMDSDLKLI